MNFVKIPAELRKDWEGVKPLEPYFLAYSNKGFFEDTGFFSLKLGTAQMEGLVGWYLMFWFFLFPWLIVLPPFRNAAQFVIWVILLVVLLVSILFLRHYYKAAGEFVYKGKLLLGTIEEFTFINHSDDDGIYEVIYSFTTPEGKIIEGEGRSTQPKSKPAPIGRSIVVLYLNDDKFTAL